MSLIKMYEESRQLQSKLNDISNQKSAIITKIKSLDAKDVNIEKELEELNTSFKDTNSKLEALNAKIKESEDKVSEVVDEVVVEDKVDELKKGGHITMTKNYLNSQESKKDFAKLLVKTGGGKDFQDAWKSHLVTKGFTNPEVLLPTAVVNEINDVFINADQSLYKQLNHTGLQIWKQVVNTDGSIQAYGHKAGNAKKEQTVTLSPIELRAGAVYKYLTIEREMLKMNNEAAILDYVLKELPAQIIAAIERAVVTGDGLEISNPDHIASFKPVLTDDLTLKVEAKDISEVIDALLGKVASLAHKENLVMVCQPELFARIKTARDVNGQYLFPIGSDVKSVFGVKEVYSPHWFDKTAAVIFDTKAYNVVGDSQIESFEDFKLEYNQHEYLAEIYAGGALVKPNAAVAINLTEA